MPTKSVTLPVWEKSHVLLRAVQGEAESRTVQASLSDAAGQPVGLAGASVRLYVSKPDGTAVFLDGTVPDPACGTCSFTLPSGVTDVPGIANCQILVSWPDNRTLKVLGLTLDILPSGLDEALESSSEFSALVSALNRAELSADTAGQASADAERAVADGQAAAERANAAAASAHSAASAADQAAQDAESLYRMTNPLTGQTAYVTEVINGLTAYLFHDAVDAQVLDDLNRPAQNVDALDISAVDFDTGAKTKLEVS